MRSLSICLTLLIVAGCNSKPSDSAPITPAVADKPDVTQPTPTPAAPTEAPAAKSVTLNEDLVKRFIGFEKERLTVMLDFAQKSKDRIKDLDKKGTAAALKAVSDADADAKKLDETVDALRQKNGLSANELREAEALFEALSVAQMMAKQSGVDATVANFEKQMKAQLDQLPPEARAEAKAEMDKALQDMKSVQNAADARKKYGDAIVDYALKNGDEVIKLRLEAITKAFGK